MCGVSRTVLGGLPQKMLDEREWLAGWGSPLLLPKLREPDKCLGTWWSGGRLGAEDNCWEAQRDLQFDCGTWGSLPMADDQEPRVENWVNRLLATRKQDSPAPSLSCFPPLRIPDLRPSMLSSPGHENSFGVAGISPVQANSFCTRDRDLLL